AGADVPVIDYSFAPPAGLLLEPNSINLLLQSRNFTTAPWTNITGACGVVQDETGVDGTANKAWTLTDGGAGVNEGIYHSIDIDPSNENYIISVYVKKASGAVSFPGTSILFWGTAPEEVAIVIDTDNGTVTAKVGSVPDAYGIREAGNFWRVWCAHKDSGGNMFVAIILYPAISTDGATWTDDTPQGSSVFDCAQMEKGWGTVATGLHGAPLLAPTSYIDNDGVALGAELITVQANRDFSAPSNWENDFWDPIAAYDETGDLSITADARLQFCYMGFALMSRYKVYRVQFDVANIVGSWYLTDYGEANKFGTVTVNGPNTFYAVMNYPTSGGLKIKSNSVNSSGDFDNFSVKEYGNYRVAEHSILEYTLPTGMFSATDKGTLVVLARFGYACDDFNFNANIVSVNNSAISYFWHSPFSPTKSEFLSEKGSQVVFTQVLDGLYKPVHKWGYKNAAGSIREKLGVDDGNGLAWGGTEPAFGAGLSGRTGLDIIYGQIAGPTWLTFLQLYDRVLTKTELDSRGMNL
ncbi:MAG: hypothetical protein ABH886_10370, partial [Candidatus Desantisbacteria bacterium]